MLSNPLEDEDRLRGYIDDAIKTGEVEAYKSYTNETAKQKEGRMREARNEGEEAMAYAEKLGVKDKLFGEGSKTKKDSGEDALAALIKQRQAGRGNFFDHLEEKYGAQKSGGSGKTQKGKNGKKRTEEEDEDGMPSEEAFQAAAARLNGTKAAKSESSEGRKAKRAKR
jgi:DnaJ family protein C protein 9